MNRRSSCPYAEALLGDGSSSTSASAENPLPVGGRTTDSGSTSAAEFRSSAALPSARSVKACPAFSSGSCPFKDAQSAEQVQETLLKIPPSHFQNNAEFLHVIQGLHKVKTEIATGSRPAASDVVASDGALASNNFSLPGGCPVQRILKEQTSFTEAMEEFSLSSIMASLARELEAKRGDNNDGGGERQQEEAAARALIAQVAMTSTLDHGGVVPPAGDDKGDDSEPGKAAASAAVNSVDESEEQSRSLSSALKTGTAVSHKAAEDVHFVSNFIRGKIDRELYKHLVAMLYHVYVALEECLDRHGPAHFATCHFPRELERKSALQEDLEYWHGTDTRSIHALPEMSSATRDYVDRIRHVSETNPLLLLSHAYTRYLGDLSGGKILARVARRALDLDKGEGLAFYEFANIDSPKLFKDRYRAALDALPLSSGQVDELVGEANVAFLLNMRLFEELDVQARVPGASVRPLREALSYANLNNGLNAPPPSSDNKCPFIVKPSANTTTSKEVDAAAKHDGTKRCPWPFILMHDPATGMRDVKTWAVLGLVLCWIWSLSV
jgi:heme oxygenase (biliverdin-producing, ferredoxin)